MKKKSIFLVLLFLSFVAIFAFPVKAAETEANSSTEDAEISVFTTLQYSFESLNEVVDYYDYVFVATITNKLYNLPYDGTGNPIPYTYYSVKVKHVIKGVLGEYEQICYNGGYNAAGELMLINQESLPAVGETYLYYGSKISSSSTREYVDSIMILASENQTVLKNYKANKSFSLQNDEIKNYVAKYKKAYQEGYQKEEQVILEPFNSFSEPLMSPLTSSPSPYIYNKDFADAGQLYIGQKFYSVFESAGDMDFYKFTGDLTTNYYALHLDNTNKSVYLRIYRADDLEDPVYIATVFTSSVDFVIFIEYNTRYYFTVTPTDPTATFTYSLTMEEHSACAYSPSNYDASNLSVVSNGTIEFYANISTSLEVIVDEAASIWSKMSAQTKFIQKTTNSNTYDLYIYEDPINVLEPGARGWYICYNSSSRKYAEIYINTGLTSLNFDETYDMTLKTVLHEMGHAVGLKDMYNTNTFQPLENSSNAMTNTVTEVSQPGRCDAAAFEYVWG